VESLPFDLTRPQRKLKATGLARKECGLVLRNPSGGGKIESAIIPAPMVFTSVGASWVSTAADSALVVKLRTSANKRKWSDWNTVSGEGVLREPDKGQTISKPVTAGRAGYVQLLVEWQPVSGAEPGCLREMTLEFVGEGLLRPSPAVSK
jgi:hypothetical protein